MNKAGIRTGSTTEAGILSENLKSKKLETEMGTFVSVVSALFLEKMHTSTMLSLSGVLTTLD
jgi:hypothetical protein